MPALFGIAICSLGLPQISRRIGATGLVILVFTGMPPSPHLPTGILHFLSSYLRRSTLPGYRLRMPVAALALSGCYRKDWAATGFDGCKNTP
jgi:hypothetical protein